MAQTEQAVGLTIAELLSDCTDMASMWGVSYIEAARRIVKENWDFISTETAQEGLAGHIASRTAAKKPIVHGPGGEVIHSLRGRPTKKRGPKAQIEAASRMNLALSKKFVDVDGALKTVAELSYQWYERKEAGTIARIESATAMQTFVRKAMRLMKKHGAQRAAELPPEALATFAREAAKVL